MYYIGYQPPSPLMMFVGSGNEIMQAHVPIHLLFYSKGNHTYVHDRVGASMELCDLLYSRGVFYVKYSTCGGVLKPPTIEFLGISPHNLCTSALSCGHFEGRNASVVNITSVVKLHNQ